MSDCRLCDTARHICPGCGTDVPHGTIACEACSEPDDRYYPECLSCAEGRHYAVIDGQCVCCGARPNGATS